jgi:hypothetical protein
MHSPELYTQAVVTRAGEVALSDAPRLTVNASRPVAGAKVTVAARTAVGLVQMTNGRCVNRQQSLAC